jgi:hypothetical protein
MLKVVVLGALLTTASPLLTLRAFATTSAVARCRPGSLRISEYGVDVGMSHADELFWIRNASSRECTLRGYVRVSYVGRYESAASSESPKPLSVQQQHTLGGDGTYGGVKAGLAIPTVTLKPKGMASFWILGTDSSYRLPNGRQSRCISSNEMLVRLPGAITSIDVSPIRAGVFFWCGGIYVYPITFGDSGTDPARPLSYFRGITV